jgi:uncharacterized protein (DUF58 family)
MDNKLQEIIIRAKKDVFGGNIGDALTTFKGDGLDFREIKEYEIGDDVKKINWKATAKTNSTKVNVFNVDRELNIVIAFLVSGSIHFGTVRFKQELISEIAAILAYSTIKNNNLLSSLIFSNKDEIFYPASKSEASVYNSAKSIFEFDCLEKDVDYEAFCDHINSTVKQKSIIFVIGDFYGDIDLSTISYKHEVYALIVRDRFEEYPYISGEYDFVSPIDFSSTFINMDKNIAKNYQKLILQNDKKLYEHLEQHQITAGKIYTNDDIYSKLAQIIKG